MPLRPTGVLLILIATLCAQQQQKSQSVFNLEAPVTRPVPIPPRALELIREDGLFQEEVESLSDTGSNFTKDWLVASEIDLGCTRGLIVMGQGPLLGANIGPFWIFATDAAGNYNKPLAVRALSVEVHGHGKSCREVRASSVIHNDTVATTSFRLEKGNFVRHRSWTKGID